MIPEREEMIPEREEIISKSEGMIPESEEIIPKREEMIPKRNAFHCSGSGSFVTALWLDFYPSFLSESCILTSGLALAKGHPHWWDCSVAAISSLSSILHEELFLRRTEECRVMTGFVFFSHQSLPEKGFKEISIFYICWLPSDKGKDTHSSCTSCTPGHPSVAEDK